MHGIYVTGLVLISILHTQLSSSDLQEEDFIVLTHSMSGSSPRKLIGKAGEHQRYYVLMPRGFQSYLVNNSDQEVSIKEDGFIDIFSDNPGTKSLTVSIIDNRNFTDLNVNENCSGFQISLHIEVLKNKTSGSCGRPPALRKPLDFITLSFGNIFRQQLDPDYFYDLEDGDTRQLSVSMTTGYGDPLPSNHFIQFDSTNQVIYGLVMNETATKEEVLLVVAKDLCGQSSYDAIGVDISINSYYHSKDTKFGFVVEFSSVPACPIEDLKNMYVFVQELKKWFNDSREIFIKKRENCTLHLQMENVEKDVSRRAGSGEITAVVDNKGEISTQFKCFFLPSFQITRIHFIKLNTSLVEKDYDTPTAHYSSDINHWLEIVLPVVIILCFIVIIVIVLYVCYARKKKLYILQSEKPTFLEERSPVIFQTEVPVEDPALSPRDPIILSHFDEIPSSETELLEHRSLPSTPDYTPPTCDPPPTYRLPPPYTTSHQYW